MAVVILRKQQANRRILNSLLNLHLLNVNDCNISYTRFNICCYFGLKWLTSADKHDTFQVVSACQGGSVIVWMADSGQKVKQFSNTHGTAELTCLAQDYSETRLFTGSTDGTVKVGK